MYRVDDEVGDTKDQKESERQFRLRPYKAPCLHEYGALTSLTCNGTFSVPEGAGPTGNPAEGKL